MISAFPTKCAVIVRNQNLRELIRVLHHCIKCAQIHNTKYDKLNFLYIAVLERKRYALYYAHLVYNNNGDPVMDEVDIQECQDMPDDPEYPGEGPSYDTMNPENSVTICDTWEQKNMFHIEDKPMNQALCKLLLYLFLQEFQITFKKEFMVNPNMKFKDMCQIFCNTCGRVTKRTTQTG